MINLYFFRGLVIKTINNSPDSEIQHRRAFVFVIVCGEKHIGYQYNSEQKFNRLSLSANARILDC